jgi:hypothetical protein
VAGLLKGFKYFHHFAVTNLLRNPADSAAYRAEHIVISP